MPLNTKSMNYKKKLITWTSSKLKASILQKIAKEIKKKATGYEKIFAKYIQPCLALLLFPLLCFLSQTLCFSEIEDRRQPCFKQANRCHLSNSICSLPASMLHFGESHNISKFFIVIIFVMVIFDATTVIVLRSHEQQKISFKI